MSEYGWGQGDYQPGGVWGICDRCAFKHRRAALRTEWSGLVVCEPCLDPKPADMSPPNYRPDGLPIRNPRPDPDAVTVSEVNTTSRDDL